MSVIFDAPCEVEPDEDSIRVETMSRKLIFIGTDTDTPAQTSVVLGPVSVEKLRDELTKWLESMEQAE